MLCEKCVYYDVCRDEYKGRLMCASFEYNQDLLKLKRGEWLDTGDEILDTTYSGWKCSECGYIFCGDKFKLCPECGAKMDGGKVE